MTVCTPRLLAALCLTLAACGWVSFSGDDDDAEADADADVDADADGDTDADIDGDADADADGDTDADADTDADTDADADADGDADADTDADGDADRCDVDQDGALAIACGGGDCDDADPSRHPGAVEWEDWQVEEVGPGITVGSSVGAALGPDGSLHVTYWQFPDESLGHAWLDAGGWSTETVDDRDDTGSFSSVAVSPDGDVHVAYRESEDSEAPYNVLEVATNASGLWTHRTVDAETGAGNNATMLVDSSGAAHVVYTEDEWGDGDLRHATNAGGAWAIATVFVDAALRTVAVMDDDDVLHAVYEGGGGLHYATNAGGDWSEAGISDDDTSVLGLSMALGPDGLPQVVNYDFNQTLIRLFAIEGGRWTSTDVSDADPDDFADVGFAVDAAGHRHLAWVVAATGAVRYTTDTSGAWESEAILDSHLDPAPDPALVVDTTDVIHVIAQDPDWTLVHAFRTVPDGRDRDCDGR